MSVPVSCGSRAQTPPSQLRRSVVCAESAITEYALYHSAQRNAAYAFMTYAIFIGWLRYASTAYNFVRGHEDLDSWEPLLLGPRLKSQHNLCY